MIRSLVSGLALLALAPGAWSQTYQPPRKADGHPDLEGVWDGRVLTPLERPPGVDRLVVSREEATRLTAETLRQRAANEKLDPAIAEPDLTGFTPVLGEYRTSMVVAPADGKLPLTEAGKKLREAVRQLGVDDPEQRPAVERCISGNGMAPFVIGAGGMFRQIVQTPAAIVLHTESQDDTRIVRMDAKHPAVSAAGPMGDGIGWWEGDTLVVETTDASSSAIARGPGNPLLVRPEAKVTERFTRVGPDELLYQFTVDDPAIYAAPWRAEFSLTRSDARLYEWSCHEANYSLANTLQAGRAADRAAQATARPVSSGPVSLGPISSRKRSSGPARRP